MVWPWIVAGSVGILFIVAALVWPPVLRARRKAQFERARREFRQRRERLEARFLELAASSGKPRGLRWTDCEFDDPVTYARDGRTGEFCAFVGVTIYFDAIEGGGMEENENVRRPKAATAEFRLRGGQWQTSGRAIFNLNPSEAVAHENLEALVPEAARVR